MEPPTAHSQTWQAPRIFNDYDEKYKLCCCHIRNWATAVGVLEVIYMILYFGSLIRNGADESYFAGRIIVGIIWVIVLILLFSGLRKENPGLLIPHLVLQVLQVIGFLALGIMALVVAAGDTFLTVAGIICLVAFAVEIFFIYVIIRCFKFFTEKRAAMAQNTTITVISRNLDIPQDGYSNPVWQGATCPPYVVPCPSMPPPHFQGQSMEVSSHDLPPPYVSIVNPTGPDGNVKA